MNNTQTRAQCQKCRIRFKIKNLVVLMGGRFCSKCAKILQAAAYREAAKENAE